MPLPNETPPIERRPARHTVFEQLRDWIEEGVLAPGEALRDSEIASALGVSRTPVREALQMLETIGAVEMLPGRLTRVTALSPQDVALLYAPLSALHGISAELGTPRATPADVAEMEAHNERLRSALDAEDAVAARDADREFHAVLLRLAENPYLVTAIEPLLLHARRLETLYFRLLGPAHESLDEHQLIIEAVDAGDAARAAELTRHNFTRFWTPANSPGDGGVPA
ncbi:MAG TPA: GntR family transcriptional regulator [Conexibacter sp.]|nr:GntR family transcriptional regulator [Conexibacter sp.]